jgi:hypothetical protein
MPRSIPPRAPMSFRNRRSGRAATRAAPAEAGLPRAPRSRGRRGVVEAWAEAGRFVEAYDAVADRGYELVA